MALIPCPHCGNQISDKATKCPKCSGELTELEMQVVHGTHSKKRNILLGVAAALIVLIGIAISLQMYKNTAKANLVKTVNSDVLVIPEQVEFTSDFLEKIKQYDELCPFREGLAAVRKDDKYGYINTLGDLVIPCQFGLAGGFSEGLAFVMETGNKQFPVFINKQGEVVMRPQICINLYSYSNGSGCPYDSGYIDTDMIGFRNGLCCYYSTDGEEVYIDKKGNILNTAPSNWQPSDEYVEISSDDGQRHGIADKNGTILIPAIYSEISMPDNGVALAKIIIDGGKNEYVCNLEHEYKVVFGYVGLNGLTTFTTSDFASIEEYKNEQDQIRERYIEENQKEQQAQEVSNSYSSGSYSGGSYGNESRSSARSHRQTTFRTPDDVMAYLAGKTFSGGGLNIKFDYNTVYMNGTPVTAAPRISNITPSTATIRASSPYIGGQDIHFYLDASRGSITIDSGESLYLK